MFTHKILPMFVHHVLFYTKPEATEIDRAALRAGLETLRQIPFLRTCHIGTPAPTNRPVIVRDYAFSLLTIFENGADEAAYQTHPVHLAFVENCKHLWERVVIYDAE